MPLDLTPVESSYIAGHHYDPQSQTLTVAMKRDGKQYAHPNVPPEVVEQLVASDSFGRAYGSLIRGSYPHADAE